MSENDDNTKIAISLVLLMIFSTLLGIQAGMIETSEEIGFSENLDDSDDKLLGPRSGSPYISVNVPYANSNPYGIGSWGYMYSYDLTTGDNYKVEWRVNNSAGTDVHTGSFSWTHSGSTSYYAHTESWTDLSVGDYCLEATLYEDYFGTYTNLSFAASCFTVVYTGDAYTYIADGEFGTDTYANISAFNLVTNVSYNLEWNLTVHTSDNTGASQYSIIDNGSHVWNPIGNQGTYLWEYLNLTFSGLTIGSFCVWIELSVQGSILSTQNDCFYISAPYVPAGDLYVDAYINPGADEEEYFVGDGLTVYLEASNLSEENYEVVWELFNDQGSEYWNDSVEIDYWNHPYWDEYYWTPPLKEGYNCINASLLLAETGEEIDSAEKCFEVTAVGNISINLGVEELVEIVEEECLDSLEIPAPTNEDDCHESGGWWDVYYDWQFQTKTEYAIGDQIVWDIEIENDSFADYVIYWTMSDGAGVNLASDSVNYFGWMGAIYELENEGMECDFKNQMDDCWDWYMDYDVDFLNAGTYCFEVVLELTNGVDFQSSDEVCLEIYATGDIYIGLGEKEWVEIVVEECLDSVQSPAPTNEDDCHESGGWWDVYYDWEFQTKTEYAIGDQIMWEITIENTSLTDYVISWTLNIPLGPTSIGGFPVNYSGWDNNDVYTIFSEGQECNFKNQMDDCWDWNATYDVDFLTAGTYCFEVVLELTNGVDFQSSDEVCLEILGAEEEESEEIIPEEEEELPWNDSDGDGVIDELDDCPDTANGSFTDSNGCPPSVDSEGGYTPGFTSLVTALSLIAAAVALRPRKIEIS